MAAARHVVVICGPTEIDGYALYVGSTHFKRSPQGLLLIRRAFSRPRSLIQRQDRSYLDLAPLVHLLDTYAGHQATIPHDRLYAMSGMCSDQMDEIGLRPDYTLPWKTLVSRLIRYLLHDSVLIQVSNGDTIVYLRSRGYIFWQSS